MIKIMRFGLISSILLLLLLTACNFQAARAPEETQSQDAIFTQAAQTVVAGITQTAEAAPAEQPPPSPTPAEEVEAAVPEEPEEETAGQEAPTEQPPTETQTPTVTVTPSETVPAQPLITGEVNTNCRVGPNTTFEVVGFLLEGETSAVHGKGKYGYWWYIANPDVSGGFCWVWAETTTVTGDVESLPIIEPPPTYTPTSTPTNTPTPTATATATP